MPALPGFTQPFLRLADSLQWLAPLFARVAVGAAFVLAGWGKLGNLEQTTAFFESLGIPAAGVQAPMVAGIELVGGGLLILGLGTRIAAALLVGVMAVALGTAILPPAEGVVETLKVGLASLETAYLAVFLYLATSGAGAVSVDRLLWQRRS